jgi:hypothetical protein
MWKKFRRHIDVSSSRSDSQPRSQKLFALLQKRKTSSSTFQLRSIMYTTQARPPQAESETHSFVRGRSYVQY